MYDNKNLKKEFFIMATNIDEMVQVGMHFRGYHKDSNRVLAQEG